MFRAQLTISKIVCEKTPGSQLGVFVPGRMNSQPPVDLMSWRRQTGWPLAISQR